MILKGQNFRVRVGGKVIACATSCTCHASAQLEETSSKDSTGDWTEQEAVSKSWDFSADALMQVDATDLTALGFDDVMDLIGEKVEIDFVQTNGDKNRNEVKVYRKGTAIINDVSQTMANKQNGTYSVQGQGCGPLAKESGS